ncbi:hypothetical protein TWF718_009203 [Orbilia javanica]|uniref:Uncharacterized protein n=1 Tax=Orbilia javanica TaxID=47235 RepID=A0AAN8NSJ9_9PEZI
MQQPHAMSVANTANTRPNPLQIPEILESIIIWSLHLHYVYDERCKLVNKLRRVAKVWKIAIEHNPTLRSFAFRDPPSALSASRAHLAIFCRPYCLALECELSAIQELELSGVRPVGLSELKKVMHSITMTHGNLIKEFRKKRKVPRCLMTDIFVTGPAVTSIYIRYSGSSDHDWLEGLRGIAKPTDFVYDFFNNFKYDYNIQNPSGVSAKDLLGGIEKSVKSFYDLPKGSFLVQTIEIWIGDPEVLKEQPQYISCWQVRKIWESNPWSKLL